ncbi:MAG: F0F1 ATP synthase subunit B [Patescibacteria group bacterium]
MEELVKTFHIDAGLLLAQLVNFLIVLLVLYKFAYGPILKTLNERTGKIEKGLKDAENAQSKLAEMEKKEKEVLVKAKEEGQKIIDAAEKTASKNKEDFLLETKQQAEKLLADADKKIEEEKAKMFGEIKSEMASLVVAATEKILNEKIDADKDKDLIKKAIE